MDTANNFIKQNQNKVMKNMECKFFQLVVELEINLLFLSDLTQCLTDNMSKGVKSKLVSNLNLRKTLNKEKD